MSGGKLLGLLLPISERQVGLNFAGTVRDFAVGSEMAPGLPTERCLARH